MTVAYICAKRVIKQYQEIIFTCTKYSVNNLVMCKKKSVDPPRHRYYQQCEKNEMVLGRAYPPTQRRLMDLASRHLETT